jgi:alpha-D-xyloside xylohydrolase
MKAFSRILLTLFFLPCVLCMGATSATATLETLPNGIRCSFPRGSLSSLRVQVITDRIVRITGFPDRAPEKPSLIVDDSLIAAAKTPFTVRQTPAHYLLSTRALTVFIDKKNGRVTFKDPNGKLLLKENQRRFQRMGVDGDSAWSIQQTFDSPSDEAFYGLGQHQSDVFNYKGKNETLYQYNTKVSVPFLVSNKHYGLLWDNYSLTRIGDPRPYANLNTLRLFDKEGQEGALTATYRNGQRSLVRRESVLDYENLETLRNFPKGVDLNTANVTWEGSFEPSTDGPYHFRLYYAGYTKVWIDDSLVVAERWRTAWNPNSYLFTLPFRAHSKHRLRIEWKPDGGESYLGLKVLDAGVEDRNLLSWWSEMGRRIDYYFIQGNTADQVISGYRLLTGKAQVTPKWSMGYWQSRERYRTQDELLATLRAFRQRRIPIDNIVQDWSYWKEDAWGSHEGDPQRFPDLKAMVKEVHDSSARIVLSVWPKFYPTTDHYKEFDAHGWMFRRAIHDSIRDWIGKGYLGSFYDAYQPQARQLFWKQMEEHLFSKGFDAWWMDASEPDIQSNASMEYRKQLMNPTALGTSTEYFNVYGLMNAKAIYEGQRGTGSRQRVFLLTRSGFAGSQRYAACIWSGDIGTRWEDLKAQIPAGMNFSIAGNPYWTMDDGGFCVEKRYERAKEGSADLDEWRELNVRWHQFGCFAPIFRSHGQFPYREPWNIAPETHPAYGTLIWYNQLRYRLMPYLYSLAGMCHFGDYTLMRPLMMDFPDDARVLNVGDQYLLGPQLLVCPVYTYQARSRNVYFPKGSLWYSLYDGSLQQGGGARAVDAPYQRMPVFVRAGSLLPVGKPIQSTAEKQTDLTLYVYGGADGTFTLYEDEGTDYGYENGAYATITFAWNESTKTLSISERKGSYPGMPEVRSLHLVKVDALHPVGMNEENPKGITVTYTGKAMTATL